MIRITTERIIEGNKKYIEGAGLSTDTKPTTGIVTGSIFTEIDTGKVFFFNETGTQWVEQFSFQG